MERPQVKTAPIEREVTGEIMYLDQLRRLGQYPEKPYLELGDTAIQNFETEAAICVQNGARPDIMGDYERYDAGTSDTVTSCIALADELLKLKKPDSPLTFEDYVVDQTAEEVLAKLNAIRAGQLLVAPDDQLAIESDGEYFPTLDVKKSGLKLEGVGVKIWAWDNRKVAFTNQPGEPYDYKKHVLIYPEDEKLSRRQLDISFSYRGQPNSGVWVETVTLSLDSRGSADISSNIWASEYAETGYEGHLGKSLENADGEDIAALADLIAEIVGDSPETFHVRQNRALAEIIASAATDESRQAIQNLVDATWPEQALYFLTAPASDKSPTIAEAARDPEHAAATIESINQVIAEWNSRG